jgi:hypothetical protein
MQRMKIDGRAIFTAEAELREAVTAENEAIAELEAAPSKYPGCGPSSPTYFASKGSVRLSDSITLTRMVTTVSDGAGSTWVKGP